MWSCKNKYENHFNRRPERYIYIKHNNRNYQMSKDNLDFIRIKVCFHRHSFLIFTFVSLEYASTLSLFRCMTWIFDCLWSPNGQLWCSRAGIRGDYGKLIMNAGNFIQFFLEKKQVLLTVEISLQPLNHPLIEYEGNWFIIWLGGLGIEKQGCPWVL